MEMHVAAQTKYEICEKLFNLRKLYRNHSLKKQNKTLFVLSFPNYGHIDFILNPKLWQFRILGEAITYW